MARLDTWFSTRKCRQSLGWTLLLVVALTLASVLTASLTGGSAGSVQAALTPIRLSPATGAQENGDDVHARLYVSLPDSLRTP